MFQCRTAIVKQVQLAFRSGRRTFPVKKSVLS
jgi:hypothetical protein